MKKILACILAVMMLASLSVAAFADGTDVGKIIIDSTKTGHTYLAYQIFTGNVAVGSDNLPHLQNITWGSNISAAGMEALCTKYAVTIPAGQTAADMAATVATALQGKGAVGADDLANFLQTKDSSNAYLYLTGTPVSGAATGNTAEIAVPAQGYYLVIDTPDSLSGHNSYTDNIIVVVGEENVKVSHKNSVPNFMKKVAENGGLEDGTGNTDTRLPSVTITDPYNDTADYKIGDVIPYELVATVSGEVDRYDNYKMEFVDDMNGMTYEEGSIRVVLRHTTGDVTLDSNAYNRFVENGGKRIRVALDVDRVDGKLSLLTSDGNQTTLDAGTVVIVYYNAVLGADAAVGATGNKNTATLRFSNNPNNKESMGTTPEDTNIVYTYALDVLKQNAETHQKLEAGFKLQRTIITASGTAADPNGWAILTEVIEDLPTGDAEGSTVPVITGYKINGWTTEANATEFKTLTRDDRNVKIIGLDEGHYFLKETTAPAGYSLLAQPIELAVAAVIGNTQSWDGNGTTLDSLKLAITDPNKMSAAINGGNGDVATGTVGINIANNATAQLPTTGGMGTTLFYVFGATLALGAAILLVVKRRMSVEEM